MNQFFNSLIPIALFATIFGVIYVIRTAKQKERMALIEKGADASLFYSDNSKPLINWSWSKFTLKIGMFLMGIALGIIGGALATNFSRIDEPPILYFSSIFFFGGLSLTLYYIIMDRKK